MGESSIPQANVSTGTLADWFATPPGQYLRVREQRYPFNACLATRASEVPPGRLDALPPPQALESCLNRFEFFDKAGGPWLPIVAGVCFLRATKLLHGMVIISPQCTRRLRKKAVAS